MNEIKRPTIKMLEQLLIKVLTINYTNGSDYNICLDDIYELECMFGIKSDSYFQAENEDRLFNKLSQTMIKLNDFE